MGGGTVMRVEGGEFGAEATALQCSSAEQKQKPGLISCLRLQLLTGCMFVCGPDLHTSVENKKACWLKQPAQERLTLNTSTISSSSTKHFDF